MFNSVTYRLPPISALKSVETREFAELDDALYVALEPGRTTLRVVADKALRLSLEPSEPVPDWCELVAKLLGSEWLRCRALRVTLCAEAAEGTNLKIALRVFKDGGFQDHFLTTDLMISQCPNLMQAAIDIAPEMAHGAQGFALHLFLDNAGFELDLHDLEILGFL